MLDHDGINVLEAIDINRTNASKECDIFIIGILKILFLNMNHIFAMAVMI